MIHKRSKPNKRNVFSHFWNEFLFARNFEYETPLTPDEVVDSLKTIEDQKHKMLLLSLTDLKHDVTVERHGDKASDFKIELQSEKRDKWWETGSSIVYAEGTITAEQDTGITRITGRTRFNGQYYAIILFMFLLNFTIQSLQSDIVWSTIWITLIVVFWGWLYMERNNLSDRIDTIIMNAKALQAIENLSDDSIVNDVNEDTAPNSDTMSSLNL
ncbi:MAG: hypothetical protein WBC91_21430 [Phototrophicaceae bacterium]